MEDLIGNVADATFDQYFNAPASVVVYGIANCEGCAYMDGVLAEVAPEFQNKVRFGKGKMHVPGAAREIKKRFSFETYPTIHFFTTTPCSRTSVQSPVSSNEPTPTWPQVNVVSVATIAGVFMSSK